MKKTLGLGALISALGTSMPLQAMPYDTPDTWGGDLESRARLTGNWGGARDDMAKKLGIVDDAVFTVAYIVRAVSPGKYVLPQAYVEDMYNPSRYGRTGTGTVEVRPAK